MAQILLAVRELRVGNNAPVDLDVPVGGCAVVTGASGSGKTRLLRAIADLDPNVGRVSLDGRDRDAVPAPDWRRRVAYVPAEPGWWAVTPAAHFEAPARARGNVDHLGLDAAMLDRPVSELSTGERQRLALLRALERGPMVLLLDEPTSALDDANRTAVAALLAERLAAGAAIVLVTHDGALADELGTARYRMTAGRLEAAA